MSNVERYEEEWQALNPEKDYRAWLEEQLGDDRRLFEIQHTRTAKADKLWRVAHPGNERTVPDLGDLVEWLMERANTAEREIAEMRKSVDDEAREQEAEG